MICVYLLGLGAWVVCLGCFVGGGCGVDFLWGCG